MNKIIRTNTFLIQRCISTSSVNSKNVAREGRFMGKLMRKDSQHTRKWYNFSPPKSTAFATEKYGPSRAVLRRMTVLNKLFMGHISDIMSTGEVLPELLNRGIEITSVGVTSNFSYVHVYWIDKSIKPEYSLETQELLNNYAPALRHKLIELHVMGSVPKIQFLRDKNYNITKEIDYLLSIADCGPDLKATPLVGLEQEKDSEAVAPVVPQMRNDVFGVDHARIMSKIKASLKKARNATTRYEERSASVNTSSETSQPTKIVNVIGHAEQKLLMSEFIRQRKADERKKYNEMRKRAKGNISGLYATHDNEDYNGHENDNYDNSGESDDYSDYDDHDKHDDHKDNHGDHYKDS